MGTRLSARSGFQRFPCATLGLFCGLVACKDDANTGPTAKDLGNAVADAANGKSADTGAADAAPSDATAPECHGGRPEVVVLTTDDGVGLEADFYAAGQVGGGAVVLLHMIPPSNDRTNYPPQFIEALVDNGLAVLNVDRRGAGKSEGVAQQAYTGPNGRLDAKAAYQFLVTNRCAFDAKRIAFVGASNGTATALDFAVFAAGQAGIEVPSALVFLTGGSYTENQNKIAEHRSLLDRLAILFVYSTAEKSWSAAFQPNKAKRWKFREYAQGDHGTRMFKAQPGSMGEVAAFLGQ